jgi:methyl-accepting chemotaxis protein
MSLFTSVMNAFGADKAAKTQERAARAAGDMIRQQYEQTRADLSPYRDAGATALGNYSNLLGMNGKEAYAKSLANYTESPFLAQLVKRTGDAVDASRAARGGLFSGATAQAIGDRTGQLFLGDFNTYLGNLGNLAQQGQNASAQTANYGAQAAGQRADLHQQVGAFKAQQAVIPSMAWQQFMNDVKSGAGMLTGGAFGR